MKVYRGIREEYRDDFKRNFKEYRYLNCFTFWAVSKEYARDFGPNILEKDIDPSKFFDLNDEDEVEDYYDYFNEDIVPAEQNINFALFLAFKGYDGYTRIDSDDGESTDESEREYVILNKNDKELLRHQHNLVDYSDFTEDACKEYLFRLMWKAASQYEDNLNSYRVPKIINEYTKELGIDGLLEIDSDYAGEDSIDSINEDSILEIVEKLRNAANISLNERAFVEGFLRMYGKDAITSPKEGQTLW